MTKKQNYVKSNQLSDIFRLLTASEEGRQNYIYPKLRIGDVWWIPQSILQIRERKGHPWVIVVPYTLPDEIVKVVMRTTSYRPSDLSRGFETPAGVPPGLNLRGLFLLDLDRQMKVEDFSECRYVGRLPDEYVERIKNYMRNSTQ